MCDFEETNLISNAREQIIKKAVIILQKTNDGDDLSQLELKIVEMAVNDHLNEKGKEEFEGIYKKYV